MVAKMVANFVSLWQASVTRAAEGGLITALQEIRA
jgi:hypothetical protein